MMKMTFSTKPPQPTPPVSKIQSLLGGSGGIGGIGGSGGGFPVLSMQNDMFGRLQNSKSCGSCGGFR